MKNDRTWGTMFTHAASRSSTRRRAMRSASSREATVIRTTSASALGTLGTEYKKLDPNAEIVLHCHMGMRSMDATQFLLQQGFKNVKNLTGGINAWSLQIDPSVPRY